MQTTCIIDTIDTHTAGEPTRLIPASVTKGCLSGTVLEKRDQFAANHDDIRRLLLKEPRGHSDMFGAMLVEPSEPEADCGLFFMDNDGYLNMCGHGTIGAITALIETGKIEYDASNAPFVVETPSGLVTTEPIINNGSVEEVSISDIYSFYYDHIEVDVEELGVVPVDVVYAGNFFALVDVNKLGVELEQDAIEDLVPFGLDIRRRVNEELSIQDPLSGEYTEVGLTEFYEPGSVDRNVTVFGTGQVDRSPCGTGTCAKMALLNEKGELGIDESYFHESIIETQFEGRIIDKERVEGTVMNVNQIVGSAYITGKNTFFKDPDDPISGFNF